MYHIHTEYTILAWSQECHELYQSVVENCVVNIMLQCTYKVAIVNSYGYMLPCY